MNKLPQNWRTTLFCLPAALVLGGVVWMCAASLHGWNVLISDHTPFEYDHNLPRNYDSRTISNLKTLQVVTIAYAQRHKGTLPPMQTSGAAFSALRVGLGQEAKHYFQNPATEIPFTPNAALSNKKMGSVSNCGRAILFYDANPPIGYRESYYATIKGVVGHVPVAALPALLAAADKINH